MNWVDLFIAVVLLAAVINGARRGLFRELMSFLAFAASVLIAITHSNKMAEIIAGVVNFPPYILFIVSTLLLFALSLAVFLFLGIGLYKMVSPQELKNTDKFGGGVLGLFRGGLIISMIFTMLLFFPIFGKVNTMVDQSFFAPTFRYFVPTLYDYTFFTHPDHPTFTGKVRQTLEPSGDSGIEIAKREGHKTSKASGDHVMDDLEYRFGEQNSGSGRRR